MNNLDSHQVKQVIEVVRNVREILLPHFGNIEFQEKANARDLVTKYDVAVEEYLKEKFKKIAPAISFVGEETGGDRASESLWLVDPIDGTGHFVRGIGHCSTMVSLIHKEVVVFSVIHDFVNDDLYHVVKGEGAYKNDRRIYVSERQENEAILGWEIKRKTKFGETLINYLEDRFSFYNTLCAGMPFALVAEGKLDGLIFYEPYGNDYDFAAGSLLVSEAGGVVENFNKDSYYYQNRNFIACNGKTGTKLKAEIEGVINVQIK